MLRLRSSIYLPRCEELIRFERSVQQAQVHEVVQISNWPTYTFGSKPTTCMTSQHGPPPLRCHSPYCHTLYRHPLHSHPHLCSACSMLRRNARFSSYVALLANSCWNSLHVA